MATRAAASVKERALRLLSFRSRSRAEMTRRLERAGFEPEEVEAAVQDLERVGLIDDERFARELAEHHRRRGNGRRVGLAALRMKGVDRGLAEQAVEETNPEDEAERAAEVAARRLPRLRNLEPELRQRRLFEFLLRRGYDPEVARGACFRAMAEEEVT